MARPGRIPIDAGIQGWEGKIDDDFRIVLDQPFPIFIHTGNETTLQATWPANSYDQCFIWVSHSVLGKTLYWSDSGVWYIYGDYKAAKRSVSGTTTQTLSDQFVLFTGAGGVDYDFLTASAWAGRTVRIRNGTAGIISMDPNGSELINGSSTSMSIPAGDTAFVYSDGTELHAGIAAG